MSVNSARLTGFGRKTNSNLTVAPGAVTVTANTQNVNLYTLAGSPAGVVTVTCTINSGVYCYASNTTNYGFRTGAFAAGSTITIINNGFITGMGGNGCHGDGYLSGGFPAGPAFLAEVNCTINGSGQINGGGGGGGAVAGGSGGGGGQSFISTSGGGTSTGYVGGSGTVSGPGAGGAGFTVPASGENSAYDVPASPNGGSWGAPGGTWSELFLGTSFGGAGGNSINRNGKTVSYSGITLNGAVVG